MENSVYVVMGNCKVSEMKALVSSLTEIKGWELK